MGRNLMIAASILACGSLFVQGARSQGQKNEYVAAAEKEALRAVNFRQGDTASLKRAQADFTPDGWKEYMKSMQDWLDASGAPRFTSSFAPSRRAVVISQASGSVHFRIPGTLKQTQKLSSTTYRAAIDVVAGGNPAKIQHLEQITCTGKSTACD